MRDFTLLLIKRLESITINSISIFVSSATCVSCASRIFRGQGSKLFEKEQTNLKIKRNKHESYISDILVTF